MTLATLAVPAAASAAWNQPVGGPNPINEADDEGAFTPSLTVIGGTPYVAWTEFSDTNHEIRVARLNAAGTDWQQVVGGESPINQSNDQNALDPSLASIGGVPYVAWYEGDADGTDIRVARLNGAGEWEEPWTGVSPTSGGINQASNQPALEPSLAEIGGVAYVAWRELDSTNYELRVARLSGMDWEEPWAGVSATSGGINQDTTRTAFEPSLTSVGGVPHVAWSEADGVNDELRVSRLNGAGTAWEQLVGGASPINQADNRGAFESSLTAIGGVPYVAWRETDGVNREVRVSRPNGSGTAWEQVVGGASPINQANNQAGSQPSLTAIGGVPYISWTEFDGVNNEIRVSRLNGASTAWEQPVGGASPINQADNRSSLAPSLTAIGGVPYVAWSEPDSVNEEIRVSRLQPEYSSPSALPTATGATLSVDVNTFGLSYPVGFEYGPGLTSSTTTKTTSSGFETVTRQLTGLTPSTAYEYRAFATAGIPAPRVAGATQSFTTLAQDGPGPQGSAGSDGGQGAAGPQGATGPQGTPGRDALVTCKVRVRRRKPRIKCTVTFPSAGARRVKLEVVRKGTVYARGSTRSGGSVVLDQRGEIADGRYTLRVTTIDRDGGRFLSESKLGVG